MNEFEVVREASEEEKREFIELGTGQSIEIRFMKESAKHEQEATRKHLPYDRKGAYDDFNDKKSAIVKRADREYGEGGTLKVKLEDFKFDWAGYSDLKRFDVIGDSPVVEEKIMDGMRTPVTTGKNIQYKVKGKRYTSTVFVPRVDEDTLKKNI